MKTLFVFISLLVAYTMLCYTIISIIKGSNAKKSLYHGQCVNVCTPFKVDSAHEFHCMCNTAVVRRDFGPAGTRMKGK